VIYSRQAKVLFVHIQRTGGTSLANLLLKELPGARRLGGEHAHATVAMRHLGHAEFGQCFRFSFVRNPWDRMLSWFIWAKQGGRHAKQRFDVRRRTTFAEFLANPHPWLATPQLAYLRNTTGELIVDHIYRFEDYLADVAILCERLRIDASKLPHAKGSRHAPYTTYYTADTRQLVAERFAEDIAVFGYRFGE